MTDYRVFELAGLSVDAVMDENRWLDVCDRMVDEFQLRTSLLFMFPLRKTARPMPFFSSRFRENDYRTVRRFLDADDRDDLPAYDRLSRMRSQRLYSEWDLYSVSSDAELPPSSMRDLMEVELGTRARLVAKLNLLGPWMDTLALHPPVATELVDQRVFQDVNALLPVFAKCMNTHRAMATLKQQFGACLAALDRLNFGTALVDEAGRIAFASSMMNDILSDRDGIERVGDRLSVGHNDQKADFGRGLARACDPRTLPGDRSLMTFSVPRRSGRSPYFVKLHAIADVHRETDIARPFALLFAVDPTRTGSLSAEGIGALGVLSPAELDVCAYLLAGVETRDIADQRDVSLETTRQQIKSVLSKLNCRNRSQLLNVALTTHLPLREGAPCPE